jgi:type IV pilus assembly protein PilM
VTSTTIGLDIGSSAARAAEIHVGKDGRRTLVRYAQVGLPHGWVVDGEINNIPGVAASLKRLWAEGGFTSTDVVLGVSGPRVFVRQADVPAALNVQDLRSSLRFNAQEMVPIPMEDASFDFSILDQANEKREGEATQRILLVAAHLDLLRDYLTVLKDAGLTPIVMDAAPLALMRAVPLRPSEDQVPGVDVIVSIGAELTTVAVRKAGVPMFIRSLSVGGTRLTETIADRLHLELAVAERVKRGALPADDPHRAQARKAISGEVRELAEEVRATIDFFVSQSFGTNVDRLIITGGASQTEDLALAIAGNLPVSVEGVDPLAILDTSMLGYDDSERARVAATATTAVGLALWPSDSPFIRLSLLPEEVAASNRARRFMTLAGTALAGLAGVLVLASGVQFLAVHSAQNQAHAAGARATDLGAQVSRLEAATSVHGKVEGRAAIVASALQGDVDWVRVLGQLAAVMPPQLSMTSFTGTRTNVAGQSASSPSTTPGVGTTTFNVTGSGGLPAAASWLNQLSTDPDLSGLSIGAISVKVNGGAVQFTSTAELTTTSQSNRAAEVQK